ncbi:MAG: hypothetical protein MJK14_27840, partial [Rivularia sp. ALOHA_DT_140]|nr:hypothetical protein [Rivularia sp. ALOHA_DT_140]
PTRYSLLATRYLLLATCYLLLACRYPLKKLIQQALRRGGRLGCGFSSPNTAVVLLATRNAA